MGCVNELHTGLESGRGFGSPRITTGYEANNPRFGGLPINAEKYGGNANTVSETNFVSSNRGIADPGFH